MKKVLEQYVKHIERLLLRAVVLKRELTHGEQKAVAYYTSAAETIKVLIDAPAPTWVGLQFNKKQY